MEEPVNGFCMKCHQERAMEHVHVEHNEKTNRRMAKGECSTCGTKMNRILPAHKPAKA